MTEDLILKKIESGRQYRNMQLEVRKADDPADDKKIVRGYATTFGEQYPLYTSPDYDIFEQVDAAAFDECDMSDVIMQYDHEGRVFARISNNTLQLTTDEHGLLIEADLGGTAEGRNLYEEIKGGYTTKMSFGFTVTEDKREESYNSDTGKTTVVRTITKVGKLYDVSAVSLPANDGTEISARSYIDGVIVELQTERSKKAETERKRKALALKLKLMED